jgi:hypothetical protein
MQHGVVLPTCEIGNDPAVIRDWAQAAEALGYSEGSPSSAPTRSTIRFTSRSSCSATWPA